MNKQKETSWKWRDGEMSVKEFFKLNNEKKKEYILELEALEYTSTGDDILLNLYSKKKNKIYFTLDEN